MERIEYKHGKGKVRLSNAGHGSGRYGACECCGEHVAEHWIGSALIEYQPGAFTYYGGMSQTFGHRECVESAAQSAIALSHSPTINV